MVIVTIDISIRAEEIYQYLRIIRQCIYQIPEGEIKTLNAKIASSSRKDMKKSMEASIPHFKLYTEGYNVPTESYGVVEAPKGEFCVSNKPYRCLHKGPELGTFAGNKFYGTRTYDGRYRHYYF